MVKIYYMFIYREFPHLLVAARHGKRILRTPTSKYGLPFRCNMIYHIPPSLSHDDSKQESDIHIDMFHQSKNDQQKIQKIKKIKKIHNLLTYVSSSCISSFTITVSNVLKCWYFSRIHWYHHQFTYTAHFFFTITDSMKTKTCVNPQTIKKH